MTDIDRHLARYMADVAEALSNVPTCKTSYGEFFVSEAVIAFDGERTNYRVVANEFGDYSVAVEDVEKPDTTTVPAAARDTNRPEGHA